MATTKKVVDKRWADEKREHHESESTQLTPTPISASFSRRANSTNFWPQSSGRGAAKFGAASFAPPEHAETEQVVGRDGGRMNM
uniref:Uncharacterized protein n=1 Tax=Globodera rostochiensis TaxID=31243 RepID=A0A914IET4_GLORO